MLGKELKNNTKKRYASVSNGICYFLPSHILNKKIEEGTKDEKEAAIKNLKISQMIRGQRSVNALSFRMAAAAHQEKRRVIYNMDHIESTFRLPGNPVRYENSNDIGDLDADISYKNLGITYDFYREVFNRNSINDGGMTMVSSVHFAVDYDNAFWNGEQMVYGDGGGGFMKKNSLTNLVVSGHELTHGVTQFEANLRYEDQPGGLNESMSDCFGIMCEQWALKQTVEQSKWLIGEGIMVEGQALRSMKDPGTAFPGDSQISKMSEYRDGMDPHISSGISNKAFYLACSKVGGHSWEKVGKVWYVVLRDRLRDSSGFQDAADNTFEVAGSLFANEPNVQKAVADAWNEVGVQAKKPNLNKAFT
jgi:Zn-dependent metalloprotease